MNTYENAQRQLLELIARVEAEPASEQQQMESLRLKTLKRMLVPGDQATLDKIERYYQKQMSK